MNYRVTVPVVGIDHRYDTEEEARQHAKVHPHRTYIWERVVGVWQLIGEIE